MRRRYVLGFTLAACQPSAAGNSGFGSTPGVTTATSTGTGSTSGGSSGTTSGSESGSGGGAGSTTEPVRDLGGMPDFGGGGPVGCKGKIDFLFVISRQANMASRQAQLVAAFPKFIDTIEAKFADFDYHIMVVTGDDGWGNDQCTELCPEADCKVGDDCCSWYLPESEGKQCCGINYPCGDLGLLSGCDTTWGAGEVFPAGPNGEANKPCPIDGGRRYLVKGQTDLQGTFACIATVGASGYGWLAQALVAAVQAPMNKLGGCNPGFLRPDALLMVTFIEINPDETGMSEGTPKEWAQAVLDAKHGDEASVVMLSIFLDEAHWKPWDRIGALAKMFPYHVLEYIDAEDYGPAFEQAAGLVDTACSGFVPPG